MIETIKIKNVKYFKEDILLKLGNYPTLEIIGNNNSGKTTILRCLEEINNFIKGEVTSKNLEYISNYNEVFIYEISFIINEKKFQYEYRIQNNSIIYERLSGQYDSYFKDIYVKNESSIKLGKQVTGDIKKYLELIKLDEKRLILPFLRHTKDNDLFSAIFDVLTNWKFIYKYENEEQSSKIKVTKILDSLNDTYSLMLFDNLYDGLDTDMIGILLEFMIRNTQIIYTSVKQNIKIEKEDHNTYLL
ncbi:Sugar ABC transporter, ATP-binding protein [Alteracholeplasma palmae J233]|uniref:Sugar ABC transporter, ATP-binding protein n=1 Tax=Alteracholeplasma palmae (strain ATCC 49389 / J233) TaxID=1318466 RepID=U4KL08_ALTPJ|nr:ATP-binding cassette domain-containing protein [Alteracholeplasma palmae]CCV64534.1 Sugar ABC transporter, ATP-binding protein [Alteracholeplasma palmae J233]